MLNQSVAHIGVMSLEDQIKDRRQQLANIRRVLTTETPGVTNRLSDDAHQQLIMNCALLSHGLDQGTAVECVERVDTFVADVRKLFGGAR